MLRFHLRSVLALVAGTLCALPAAALAAPPANDAYLQSISVNKRGTPLTEEQVRDIRDTREATVQADLFSPPAAGGGRERTDCRGATFGATVWYDFHPHADGTVRVQAAGYDAVVAVYEFDPTKAMITSRVDCANQAGATEELFVKVKKGRSYTIQVGGVDAGQGPATGSLDFTFEYLSDLDGDGVLDALDRCPQQPGSRAAAGCPPEVKASAILSATPTGNGIQIRSLTVSATRDARVTVRCRRGCSFTQARTAHSTVGFRALRNRQLPAGARLEVFVTKPKSIGSYIRYTVTRGGFRRMTRCLKPGSMRPRRRCT